MSQLPLPLAYRSADGERDFFVSEANLAAVNWLDQWPEWPMPCALLIGPAGSGKSHLARIFARRTGACIADDAEFVDAEALFHRWNAATPAMPLLMTAARPPRDWHRRLDDLASRLAATPQIRIAPPDDALLAALLAKQFRDHGLRVSAEVVDYVLARTERSFAAISRIVLQLDAAALAAGRPVSVPLARSVLTVQGDWLAPVMDV